MDILVENKTLKAKADFSSLCDEYCIGDCGSDCSDTCWSDDGGCPSFSDH